MNSLILISNFGILSLQNSYSQSACIVMALAMSAIKAKNFEMLIRSEGEWNCERRSHGSFITILPFSMYNNDIYSNDMAEAI